MRPSNKLNLEGWFGWLGGRGGCGGLRRLGIFGGAAGACEGNVGMWGCGDVVWACGGLRLVGLAFLAVSSQCSARAPMPPCPVLGRPSAPPKGPSRPRSRACLVLRHSPHRTLPPYAGTWHASNRSARRTRSRTPRAPASAPRPAARRIGRRTKEKKKQNSWTPRPPPSHHTHARPAPDPKPQGPKAPKPQSPTRTEPTPPTATPSSC